MCVQLGFRCVYFLFAHKIAYPVRRLSKSDGKKAIRKITLLDRSAEYNRFFGSTISINFTDGSD